MSETGAGPPMSAEGMSLCDMLKHHEARSQERYTKLMEHVDECCESLEEKMGAHHGHHGGHMGRAEEIHVHNVGAGDGGMGGGGLGLAALAALAGKDKGDMSPLALTAMMHRGANDRGGYGWGDGCGWGGGLGGAALGFVAGALVNNRRGGLFGGDDGGGGGALTAALLARDSGKGNACDTALDVAILQGVNNLGAAVPTTALQTQNAMLQMTDAQTLAVLGSVSNAKDTTQNAAAVLGSAVAGVKDSVQSLALFLSNQLNTVNQNVSEQGCKTRETVQASTTAILERINQNTIAELQAELAEARHHGRGKESEINISQTVSQVQAQAQQQQQQQQQFAVLSQILCSLHGLTQVAHATNSNIIAGNSGAVRTGSQTANPTNIGGVA